MNEFTYPTPGEVLQEEFMEPLGLSQNALARALHVSPMRINEIVNGRRAITADTDLRLCRYFRLSDGFFSRMQETYNRITTKKRITEELAAIIPCAS